MPFSLQHAAGAAGAAVAVGGSAAAVAGCSGMLPDDTTVLAGESAGMAGSIAAALGTLAPAPAAAPLALTGGTTVLANDCCGQQLTASFWQMQWPLQ